MDETDGHLAHLGFLSEDVLCRCILTISPSFYIVNLHPTMLPLEGNLDIWRYPVPSKKKLESVLNELLQLCFSRGCKVQFVPPTSHPPCLRGDFDPVEWIINIYKYPDEYLTVGHLATLAHEYRHFIQLIEGKYLSYWHFCLGVYKRHDPKDKEVVEADADAFAVAFLTERKLTPPPDFFS